MPLKISLKKTILLKSSPGLLPKKYRGVSFIMALNDYTLWDLRRQNVAAASFFSYAPYVSLESFHAEMDRYYKKLCHNAGIRLKLDYAQLFRNHLCWEIQAPFFFLRALDKIVQKHAVKRVILELLPFNPGQKYSKNINELINSYCKNYGIRFEKYKN